MSIKVMQWVWDCSRSRNAQRLVLLAIADCASEDGGNAYPSNAELQRKAALTDRGVQLAIKGLVELGELGVALNGGRRGTNMYRVIMTPCERQARTPEKSSPPKSDTPENSSPPPPKNLPPTPENSSDGTVPEPSSEPSSSSDADASPNAGLIVKGFIDWLATLPEPVKLTPSVIARYGKAIKALLQAHYDVATIKRALVLQTERGKAGWPSMLDSFCVEVQNRPVSAPPSKPFVQQAAEFKAAEKSRDDAVVQLMTELMEYADREHGQPVKAADARELVNGWIDSGQIDLNSLNGRVPTLYSGVNVITAEAEEVA